MFKSKEKKEPEAEMKSNADKIARETMTGDLRDCILDFIKHDKNPLPWNLQGEDRQIETIDKVTKAVEYAVERAVRILAADGRNVIAAKLDKVVIKDGIQGTILINKDSPDRHTLYDAQGSSILIVIADPDPYIGDRAPVTITPDQKELPVDLSVEDDDETNDDEEDD